MQQQQGILSGNPQQPPAPGNQATSQENSQGTQEQYDVVAGQMLEYLYSEPGLEAFKANVSTENPIQQISVFIGRLMVMSAQSAALAGKAIPPKVMFQAGMDVAKAVSELAQKSGVLTPENEAAAIEDAFFDGIALFAQEAGDEALRPQEREQYLALLKMVEQKRPSVDSQSQAAGQAAGQPVEEQEMMQ